MKLFEVKLELKAKVELAVFIPPTLWPTAAWGSQRMTVLRLEHGKVFRWEFWWMLAIRVGLARAGSPGLGLGLLPWPVTQKYDLSKPPLLTSGPTPPQASVGDRVGGIIIANSSFSLSSTFNSTASWWSVWDLTDLSVHTSNWQSILNGLLLIE